MTRFVVRLGSHGKNKFALQDHYIRGITIHERYVPSNQGPINDIAIITLASTVTFTGKSFKFYHSSISLFHLRIILLLSQLFHSFRLKGFFKITFIILALLKGFLLSDLFFSNLILKNIYVHVYIAADVQPICLPINRNVRNLNLPGRSLHVAGWGSTSFRKIGTYQSYTT